MLEVPSRPSGTIQLFQRLIKLRCSSDQGGVCMEWICWIALITPHGADRFPGCLMTNLWPAEMDQLPRTLGVTAHLTFPFVLA